MFISCSWQNILETVVISVSEIDGQQVKMRSLYQISCQRLYVTEFKVYCSHLIHLPTSGNFTFLCSLYLRIEAHLCFMFNPWTQYCKAVWDVFTSITNTAKIRSVLPFNTENCSCFHIIICFWTAVTYSDHVSLSISQDWAAFVFGNFWHQFHVVFCCYSLVSHEIIVDESVQFASLVDSEVVLSLCDDNTHLE